MAIAIREAGEWVTQQVEMFGQGSETFSGPWPTSGSMQNGVCYEAATLEPPIDAAASSSLLSMPNAWPGRRPAHSIVGERAGSGRASEPTRDLELLPTPAASNPNDGEDVEQWLARKQRHASRTDREPTRAGIPLAIAVQLLPTPAASDGERGPDLARVNRANSGGMDLVTTVERLLPAAVDDRAAELWVDRDGATWPTRWGKFQQAIERWEALTGTEAPGPLLDTNRLNPLLPEWMMGMERGWVTDVLGRAAALRCIGNAVQPQTAEVAFRCLARRIVRRKNASPHG